MKHTEINERLLVALQEMEGIESSSIESIVGGIAMTLSLMMSDLDVKEIEVGPHKITISEL